MGELTQEQVMERYEALLSLPPEEGVREAAELKAHFYKLNSMLLREQQEEHRRDGGKAEDFIAVPNPLEQRFKELQSRYRDHRAKFLHKKAEEEKKNQAEKERVLAELKDLIDNEEHIKTSYERFRDLKDRWESIGQVPAESLEALRSAYHREVARFYDNIEIHKELKELDLRKNLELRQQIVSKLEELTHEEKIKDVELILTAAKEQWDEAGPVHKEAFPDLRDRYYAALKELHRKIQAHYSAVKEAMQAGAEAKRKLIEEVRSLHEQCGTSLKEFNKATERLEAIKEEWRKAGPTDKKAHEQLWNEFKQAQNAFFDAKRSAFGEVRESLKGVREVKEGLIVKALALNEVKDWKEGTEAVKKLQEQWKRAGSAGQRDEQRLWARFKEACDAFFARKKEHFDTLDDRQAGHLKDKEALVARMNAFTLEGTDEEKLAAIKELDKEWSAIGHVPRDDQKRIEGLHAKALDRLFGQLSIDKERMGNIRLKQKAARIASEEGGHRQIDREVRQLQQQLKDKETELLTYENNMAFFAHAKKDNPLLQSALKRIEELKGEVDGLRKRLGVFKQFA